MLFWLTCLAPRVPGPEYIKSDRNKIYIKWPLSLWKWKRLCIPVGKPYLASHLMHHILFLPPAPTIHLNISVDFSSSKAVPKKNTWCLAFVTFFRCCQTFHKCLSSTRPSSWSGIWTHLSCCRLLLLKICQNSANTCKGSHFPISNLTIHHYHLLILQRQGANWAGRSFVD
jgi:hypothetical protein